LVNGD